MTLPYEYDQIYLLTTVGVYVDTNFWSLTITYI